MKKFIKNLITYEVYKQNYVEPVEDEEEERYRK